MLKAFSLHGADQVYNTPYAVLGLYLAVPLNAFFLIGSIPELRGLFDYGSTAVLAGYMVWLWNKHTLRWQDKQKELEDTHRAAMENLTSRQAEMLARLIDRYAGHVEKMTTALEKNAASANRVAEMLDGSEWCKCGGGTCKEATRHG